METGRSNVKLGLRVVRGPDWTYGDQIPEGLVGTVVEIDGQCWSLAPDKSVAVMWDSGIKIYYRAGFGNAYDLHTYDNVQCGALHEFRTCKGCGENEIAGFRWKCAFCPATDLCTWCYMSDKHDISHTFIRYATQFSIGVRVPPRCDCQNDKRLAMGIFNGAFVTRGEDWSVGNQDGGAGKNGQVVKTLKTGDVSVRWRSGDVYTYRLGSNGKVDLKLVNNCYGNFYYKSHLPVVGKLSDETIENNYFQRANIKADRRKSTVNGNDFESKNHKEAWYHIDNMKRKNKEGRSQPHVNSADTTRGTGSHHDHEAGPSFTNDIDSEAMSDEGPPPSANKRLFKIGDNVKIAVGFSSLQKLQEGHGGFPSNMNKHISNVGTVFSINDNGDVKVKFGDSGPYLFNPDVLSKMSHDPKPAETPAPAKAKADATRVRPECTICLTQEACAAFVPCGHIACCLKCYTFFKKCPICRSEVKTCFRVFIP